MAEQPMLSIGMPVFNGQRFLETSVNALLDQTFTDFELIICDNASTDNTPTICDRLVAGDDRVRVIRHPANIGAAENFTAAFNHASGQFFKWAADDDLHQPRFVEACVDALQRHPDAVLAYARAESITADGVVLRPDWGDRPQLADHDPVVRFTTALAPPRDPIPLPMFAVIRAEPLAATGLLVPMPEFDRALIAELSLHGPFIEVPDVLFGHREHNQRMGPALSADSAGAAMLLGRARRLPHWHLLKRHAASIRRRPAEVQLHRLLPPLAGWTWRWRRQLGSDLTLAALQPLSARPPFDRLIERSRSRWLTRRWNARRRSVATTINDTVSSADRVVLVDGDALVLGDMSHRAIEPLLPAGSPDGSFPATAAEAIAQLERRSASGFTHLAIAWPAFWVRDYYRDFTNHVDQHHQLLTETDDVVVYQLSRPDRFGSR